MSRMGRPAVTNSDAVWDVDSGGSKEADPLCEMAILRGKGAVL